MQHLCLFIARDSTSRPSAISSAMAMSISAAKPRKTGRLRVHGIQIDLATTPLHSTAPARFQAASARPANAAPSAAHTRATQHKRRISRTRIPKLSGIDSAIHGTIQDGHFALRRQRNHAVGRRPASSAIIGLAGAVKLARKTRLTATLAAGRGTPASVVRNPAHLLISQTPPKKPQGWPFNEQV